MQNHQKPRGNYLEKSRLEAFSDGVFAIVITLLILDIRLPEVDYSHLKPALISILPKLLAYVMSFAVIGLYWISHHYSFSFLKKTDGTILWMNLFLLLLISFIPFPTSLLGKYPFGKIPLIVYGATLMITNLTGFLMWIYLNKHRNIAADHFTDADFREQLPSYLFVNLSYLLAIILACFLPAVSYAIYIIVIAILIVRLAKRIR